MGSSESKSKQTISASDVIKSEDDASSLDDRAIRQAGFVQDVNSDLYNRLGVHAESYVQFPELEDSAFIHDFRDHVMAMARNLQKLINENESMSEKVDAMKKSLRYVDFGIGICRKAQEESARKILAKRKDVKRKKVQVRPSDPQFTKYDKEIQTASMQDVVIEFTTSAIRESSGLDELTTMLQKAGEKIMMLPSTTSVISPKGVSQPAKPKESFKNISEVDETNRRERFGKSLSVTSSVIDPQEIIQPKKTPRLNLHIGSKFVFALFPFVVILFAYGVIFYHLFHLQYITAVVRHMQSEAYTNILAACHNITVPEEDVYCQLFEPPDGINLICPDNSCDSSERCKSGITCRLSCEEWHRPMPKLTVSCLASGYWNMEQEEILTLTCVEVQCSEVQDRDCANLFRENASPNEDGTYLLVNCRTFEPLPVICDDSTMGGGWTVVQSRVSGKTDFYRNFEEFEQYFGSPDADYWLGLENLHLISKANAQSLLILMTDWNYDQKKRFRVAAHYKHFQVESRDTGYQMKVSEYDTQLPEGYLEAGDSLTPSNDMQFTTRDSDRDRNIEDNCAQLTGAAWWHRQCTDANLNAKFSESRQYGEYAMYWYTWRVKASLKEVRMLIRPKDWVF